MELFDEFLQRDAERIGSSTVAMIGQQVAGRVHPEQTHASFPEALGLATDSLAALKEADRQRALALGGISYRTLHALTQAPAPSELAGLSISTHDDRRGPSYSQRGVNTC